MFDDDLCISVKSALTDLKTKKTSLISTFIYNIIDTLNLFKNI